VLQRAGVSVTEIVRRLYEVLVAEQDVPQYLKDEARVREDREVIEKKRETLKSLVGVVSSSLDVDRIKRERLNDWSDQRDQS
ncbi:MAG: hypothetical protein RR505_09255, partial [Raoultibacter sp.]